MSLVALLDCQFRPESADEALAVLDEVLVATRGFEGCEGVEVLVQTDQPGHVVVVERWASREADTAYRAFRASEGPSPLAAHFAAAPSLTHFDVH